MYPSISIQKGHIPLHLHAEPGIKPGLRALERAIRHRDVEPWVRRVAAILWRRVLDRVRRDEQNSYRPRANHAPTPCHLPRSDAMMSGTTLHPRRSTSATALAIP